MVAEDTQQELAGSEDLQSQNITKNILNKTIIRKRRRKAIFWWLVPTVLIGITFLSIHFGMEYPEHSSQRTIMATIYPMTGFSGFVSAIPCLILGFVLWFKKPLVKHLPVSSDNTFINIPVSVAQGRLRRVLASLPFGFFFNHITYQAVLSWSNGQCRIKLVRFNADSTTEPIFDVPYGRLQQFGHTLNLLAVRYNNQKYILYLKSMPTTPSNITYASSMTAGGDAGLAIVLDTVLLKMKGIDELMERLREAGVTVSQPNIPRAVWIGVWASAVLFTLFWVVFLY